jgi:molybdopterin-synthase adenylyltransferase
LNDYDLIVSALGNPTSELALNRQVRGVKSSPPLIFSWLEPLGIGGHAVLAGHADERGCYECLYTPVDATDSSGLQNRASFAALDQTFSTSLAGCSSLYTPYGSLDAAQTAQLAARLALDVLTGRQHPPMLRSWKGGAESFLAAGFKLASRYHQSEDELRRSETSYPSPRCPVCNQEP